MILITVLTHIVTVFSVARSQKNFCSMGKILGNTKLFFKVLDVFVTREDTCLQTRSVVVLF